MSSIANPHPYRNALVIPLLTLYCPHNLLYQLSIYPHRATINLQLMSLLDADNVYKNFPLDCGIVVILRINSICAHRSEDGRHRVI